MIIRAFQIKNYRSIVDTGTCYLSHDNITALIGQNESGKTSVLEALLSFYEGRITDDVLRSDQTFPEISCIVALDKLPLNQLIDYSLLPVELHKSLNEKQEIRLVRKWLGAHNCIFMIAEPEILQFFESLRQKSDDAGQMIRKSLPVLEKQYENTTNEQVQINRSVGIARDEVNRRFARTEELSRVLKKTKKPDLQITVQQDLEKSKLLTEEAKDKLRDLLARCDQNQLTGNQLFQKLEFCRKFVSVESSLAAIREEIKSKAILIRESEHQLELCSSEKEARNITRHLEQLRLNHNHLSGECKDYMKELQHLEKVTTKILDGLEIETAMQETAYEIDRENAYLTPENIGEQLYRYLPVFEFFEDFSSLLPNKIDLEDLLNENRHAEGYNAARNFLRVAGLTADFFREKNHRILKQKIENLNSEITIDFQDYWRQHVGKNDKIRLNFELEHYDYTMPEKSGKPYLEFWIKDKQERLYPKQRSRGVRWFLSFYLELKATAKENHQNRVLLIDEPGLSLHARAQEDVLKVFEDLKENMQIVYCTHSPHLIDLHKLYRIIAVQRANADDETSETAVLDARSFGTASADTLAPVYSLMGTRLNDKQFIYPRNNIIVGDTVTYFYLDTMARLFGVDYLAHYIPASGSESIPLLANLLFGWKIDFGLLTFNNHGGKQTSEWLKNSIFAQREPVYERRVREFTECSEIEDLFSTLDFKRYILKQRIGIIEKNSNFIALNNLSRIILASDFCSFVDQEHLGKDDFDEETRINFETLFGIIQTMVD
jgi:predicted ATP-dependent endonuclease of OLD family